MLQSAGLLMYRKFPEISFFLVHPGGPFYIKKDEGVWTIPKGLPEPGEELLQTAIREFQEETGIMPVPPYHELGSIRQAGGKVVHAWAFEWKSAELPELKSNTFTMEWPPGSGKSAEFPETDRGAFFTLRESVIKINKAQIPLLEKLTFLLHKS